MLKRIKNKNAEAFVGAGIKILIAVIIGALLLTTTYVLTKDTVIPSAKEKIEGMFDYTQNLGADIQENSGSATFSDGATLSWEELMLEENGTKYGYNANKVTETLIDRNAFEECSQLTDIVIHDGVTEIGTNAFGNCSNLKSVFMPNSVNLLGNRVFYYCSKMTDITLSSGITTLTKSLFEECHALKTIVIPDSVTSVGEQTFIYCYQLENVTMSSNLEVVDYLAFNETPKLKELNLPISIKTLKWGSFSYASVSDFYYEGTKAQWNALDKSNWDRNFSGYKIHCSDGDI